MSLEIKKLTKKFNERTVLNQVDIKIPAGEIFFVLGKSGTGKSVLLKNIVGLLRPDEGEIWIEGQEVSRFSEEQYFTTKTSNRELCL